LYDGHVSAVLVQWRNAQVLPTLRFGALRRQLEESAQLAEQHTGATTPNVWCHEALTQLDGTRI